MEPNDVLPVAPEDIPEILEIAQACGLAPWSSSDYLDELSREAAYVLKTTDPTRQITGFAAARLITNKSNNSPAIYELLNIAVRKDRQNQGYGAALLSAIAQIAKRQTPAEIWLEVRASNHSAIGFYEKYGFYRTQVRRNFYSNPTEDGIVMKLGV